SPACTSGITPKAGSRPNHPPHQTGRATDALPLWPQAAQSTSFIADGPGGRRRDRSRVGQDYRSVYAASIRDDAPRPSQRQIETPKAENSGPEAAALRLCLLPPLYWPVGGRAMPEGVGGRGALRRRPRRQGGSRGSFDGGSARLCAVNGSSIGRGTSGGHN